MEELAYEINTFSTRTKCFAALFYTMSDWFYQTMPIAPASRPAIAKALTGFSVLAPPLNVCMLALADADDVVVLPARLGPLPTVVPPAGAGVTVVAPALVVALLLLLLAPGKGSAAAAALYFSNVLLGSVWFTLITMLMPF